MTLMPVGFVEASPSICWAPRGACCSARVRCASRSSTSGLEAVQRLQSEGLLMLRNHINQWHTPLTVQRAGLIGSARPARSLGADLALCLGTFTDARVRGCSVTRANLDDPASSGGAP